MDAGGCMDAWESMTEIREETDISRRGVLKKAATFSVAALGAGSTVPTSVSASDKESLVTELSHEKARRALDDISGTKEYDILKNQVAQREEQLNPQSAMVISVDEEKDITIIDIPITNTKSEKGHLGIARDNRTGDIYDAFLEYDEEKPME
jgi:hypothetical protein